MSDFNKEIEEILGINETQKVVASDGITTEDRLQSGVELPPELPTEERFRGYNYKQKIDKDVDWEKPVDSFNESFPEFLKEIGINPDDIKPEPYNPVAGDMSVHDWKFEYYAKYSDDTNLLRCKRCAYALRVKGDQTIESAAKEQDINLDCAGVIIGSFYEPS